MGTLKIEIKKSWQVDIAYRCQQLELTGHLSVYFCVFGVRALFYKNTFKKSCKRLEKNLKNIILIQPLKIL